MARLAHVQKRHAACCALGPCDGTNVTDSANVCLTADDSGGYLLEGAVAAVLVPFETSGGIQGVLTRLRRACD